MEGGLVILKTILDATSTKNILVSNCGRREGILYEYLSNHKKISLSNNLDNTITNIMDTFYINTNHANHVSYLSNLLFNQLKSLHNYGPQENKILYIASLLHDIGKNIGYDDNHLHTFYIIKNTNLYSLSHREIIITAAVAASHKKNSRPSDWYFEYKTIINENDLHLYNVLSIFLKLSNCFDRSYSSVIEDLECTISETSVKIRMISTGESELEINMANEFSEDFLRVFDKKLILI